MKAFLVVLVIGVAANLAVHAQEARNGSPALSFVEATVAGADGLPVTDLEASDIQLAVNGQSREVSTFAYVSALSGAIRTSAPLPFLWKPDDIHRTLVFVVDDMTLSAAHAQAIRLALQGFVDHRMDPRDEAAIVRTSSGTGVMQQITSNHALLWDAIERVRYGFIGQPYTLAPVLRMVLAGLSEVGGRKLVLLISEGPAQPDLPQLTERARSASAIVSAIVLTDGPGDGKMQALAQETGGLFWSGSDIGTAIGRVTQQQEGYYLIGYDAAATGRAAVSVKRPGVQTHVRPGLSDVAEPFDSSRAISPEEELHRAQLSPFSVADIPVHLAAVIRDLGPSSHIEVGLYLDIRGVAFTHQRDGFHTASVDVFATAVTEQGESANTDLRTLVLKLPDAEYQDLQRDGLSVKLDLLPVRKPGRYQILAGVHDATNGRKGAARQFLRLPEFTPGQFALSALILQSAQDDSRRRLPEDGPVIRRFRPAQRLAYTCGILNAALDAEKHTQVSTQLRIFRDGNEVFTQQPIRLPSAPPDSLARFGITNYLTLGSGTPPGFYVLELSVIDHVAGYRIVSGSIDFTVY